ncbi:MAG: protein-glutamate O-methyltransferase [Pseudomonadota bacterium]
MATADFSKYFKEQLSVNDFHRLSSFIQNRIGIKMPEAKKGMIEGRLRKRLRILNLKTYRDYCNYLFTPEGMNQELQSFIDVITTNKTDFFREPDHFDFLIRKAIPSLVHEKKNINPPIRIWSAASSTGNEAYTIAMVLSEFAENNPGFDFSILGTDISSDVLQEAGLAIYPDFEIAPIPIDLRTKYLLRSKDRKKNMVRICPQLRSKVRFMRLNLMDQNYNLRQPMDIIFLRNVMIYFDKKTQEELISRLFQCLIKGGYLFVGHSEVLHDCRLGLKNVAPAVYRKI